MSLRRRLGVVDADGEAGYVAVVSAIMLPVLIMLCAFCVDVARWYVLGEKEQKAADAAALAGVPFIPQDFDSARATALRIAAANGFNPATDSTVVVQVCSSTEAYVSSGTVPSDCQSGLRTSQLRVTVRNTIPNFFAGVFGFTQQTISRTGVSDFNGPAPIGSPCNVLGNEPAGSSVLGPSTSQLPASSAPANCTPTPQYWGNIHGPEVKKVQGDQYMPRTCANGNPPESGCAGTTNTEFSKLGYFLTIRVGASAVSRPVRLQLYDPAFVDTGGYCQSAPTGTIQANNQYPYAPTDASTRYRRTPNGQNPNQFCTGDQFYLQNGNVPTVTAFGLRHTSPTLDPASAAPERATAGASSGGNCAKQYRGYTAPAYTALQNNGANSGIGKLFHQWTDLCTFTPSEPGDYYLQIRTNVECGTPNNSTGTCPNADRVYTQSGDDTDERGNGANRFAVRAIFPSDPTAVSVSGLAKLAIYQNSSATDATFDLIRVPPSAQGKRIVFKFFDPGDGDNSNPPSGSVTMLPPSDATVVNGATRVSMTQFTGCTGADRAAGTATTTNCTVRGISSNANPRWDGQVSTVIAPIPDTYSCTSTSPYGCWVKVRVRLNRGVTDATTWTAYVTGDPVRLVR